MAGRKGRAADGSQYVFTFMFDAFWLIYRWQR
jgi:hypothetical protein